MDQSSPQPPIPSAPRIDASALIHQLAQQGREEGSLNPQQLDQLYTLLLSRLVSAYLSQLNPENL